MKQITYYTIFCVLLFGITVSCTKKKDTEPINNESFESQLDFQKFLNPTNEFRSFPFYSINDSLSEKEIKEQIRDFKQAGFGGFYLHSRSGLITNFLGEEWWKVMQASVDAANEVGLHCMFYDEDKWPSGFAGGIIPKANKDFRSKCLVRLDKSTSLPIGSEIIKTDSLYNYIMYTMQFGWDIFNGTCYVDLFNPEAVRAFIEVSYKPYIEKYKTQLKNHTPAIFSDEPHVHARYFDKKTPNLGTLSYSPWLEKKFTELYGYNLRDKLSLLFEEKENWREVRMQYYQAKALAFEESYTKQLSEFCEKNGFDYTGHYLAEDVLQKVRDRAGNTMLHYRSMQQPGMDHLGLSIANKLITARNLSSVANQFGKQKRLSELFGISGQNMNFEDRKWLAGWHSILGVNHFCPHLTLYSMKGHRKRDYPPTFSYQQPYWNYNKKIEDYLGRIAFATSVGKYNPQILVISPLESEFIKSNTDGEFTSGMLQVLESLQASHYDYDVGDEQIIADTAFVENNNFVIGEMSYQHIVMPDMISIRKSTIDLILKLQESGGLIFSTGRFPTFVDGSKNNNLLARLKQHVIQTNSEELEKLLVEKITPNVVISGSESGKIWSQTRIVKNGKLVQLYNTSHTNSISFKLKSDFTGGNVILWNPSEAQCYTLNADDEGNFEINLEASSNIWITSGTLSEEAQLSGDYTLPENTQDVLVLVNKWKGKRLSPNAITLDFARYSTNNGKTFSNSEPVIGIFNRLSNNKYYGDLTLKYEVKIEEVPKRCELVLEQPEMYNSIEINGNEFQFAADGFYIDHTFKTTDISETLKKGKNSIQLVLNFEPIDAANDVTKKRYGTEIESIYLIGDFAISCTATSTIKTQKNNTGNFPIRPVHQFSAFSITAEKETFEGDLALEGYPFYAGSFELNQSFSLDSVHSNKKYFIEFPNCESIVSIITINGHEIDSLVWSPFKADISKYLTKGENEIKITLVNSLRNLLGPHHHKGGELEKVGPRSFTGSGGFPDGKGESNWYDLRIENKPTVIWTDTYNHIPFGFIEQIKITSN